MLILVLIAIILIVLLYLKTKNFILTYLMAFGVPYIYFKALFDWGSDDGFLFYIDAILFLPLPLVWIFLVFWMLGEGGATKKDFDRGFKINKTCPRCFKKLPSMFSSKCPHCTADL